jgi:hypothetical protein
MNVLRLLIADRLIAACRMHLVFPDQHGAVTALKDPNRLLGTDVRKSLQQAERQIAIGASAGRLGWLRNLPVVFVRRCHSCRV